MNINKAAQAMGRKGGSVTGGRKAEAARANAQRAREIKAQMTRADKQAAPVINTVNEGVSI